MSDERISGVEAKRLREAATSVAAHPYYGCDRYNNGEACPACERLAEGIEALHQSAPTLCATVEALEHERDEARDCGQDGGCALSPGCQRHWMERNTELWRERDEALERLANVRAALRAGEPKP